MFFSCLDSVFIREHHGRLVVLPLCYQPAITNTTKVWWCACPRQVNTCLRNTVSMHLTCSGKTHSACTLPVVGNTVSMHLTCGGKHSQHAPYLWWETPSIHLTCDGKHPACTLPVVGNTLSMHHTCSGETHSACTVFPTTGKVHAGCFPSQVRCMLGVSHHR